MAVLVGGLLLLFWGLLKKFDQSRKAERAVSYSAIKTCPKKLAKLLGLDAKLNGFALGLMFGAPGTLYFICREDTPKLYCALI